MFHAPSRTRAFYFVACLSAALSTALLTGSCCDNDGGGGGIIPPGTVVPGFTATPTTGPRPLDVNFTNTSTGTITDFLWDFGDGTTSVEANPVHQYTEAGSYNVRLDAFGPAGPAFIVVNGLVKVTAPLGDPSFEDQAPGQQPGPPWTKFFGTVGPIGHTIHNAAGGGDLGMPKEGQQWCELGGESTDSTTPPSPGPGPTPTGGAGISQKFTFPLGKTVLQLDSLFINAEGQAQISKNDWMSLALSKVGSDGVASVNFHVRDTFSAIEGVSSLHPGQIATPPEVVTVDLLELFPGSEFTTLFELTAQVGNAGDAANASHAYLDQVRFETPGAPLTVAFTSDQQVVLNSIPIQFTDQTTGGATSWVWEFGDGFASSLQNPIHTYGQPGIYDVRLRATAPGVTNELLIDDFITVLAPVGSVDFRVSARHAETNEVVSFANLSSGPFVSWTWSFGDGQTAVQTDPNLPILHSYSSAGSYTVGLTGRFPDTTEVTNVKPDFMTVQDLPFIISSPQDQTVTVGQTATFTVVASGTSIHYEWRKNGWPIDQAPDLPSYTTPPATISGEFYTCRVFNLVGTTTSGPAFLTVIF